MKMKKVMTAVSVALLISACNDDNSSNNEPIPIANCYDDTQVTSIENNESTQYDFSVNTCNALTTVKVATDDSYQKTGIKVVSASHQNDSGSMDTLYYTVGQETIAKELSYLYRYGDDFMFKYSTITTNTDIIYSHEDEYKTILNHTLPEIVLSDLEYTLGR